MTRWLLRCPDTRVNHNNPRYGRDQITMVQNDKNKWLRAAAEMGGEMSMVNRLKAGVVTKYTPLATIDEEDDVLPGDRPGIHLSAELMQMQSLHPDAIQSTKELLSYSVQNTLKVCTVYGVCVRLQ